MHGHALPASETGPRGGTPETPVAVAGGCTDGAGCSPPDSVESLDPASGTLAGAGEASVLRDRAVEPLRRDHELEVAYGMADADTIQRAVTALEARGVGRTGVVRLFVSSGSWFERTEQILGIRDGAAEGRQ